MVPDTLATLHFVRSEVNDDAPSNMLLRGEWQRAQSVRGAAVSGEETGAHRDVLYYRDLGHVPIRDILIERRGIAEHGPAVSGAGVVIDM